MSSDDVLDAIARAIHADDWGGDYGYADESHLYLSNAAAALAALAAAGYVVVKADGLQHGDELQPVSRRVMEHPYIEHLFSLRRSVCSDTPAVPGVRSTKIQHYVDTMREPSAADTPEQETNQ